MQHSHRDDPYEREPLDASRDLYDNTPPRPPPHGYSPSVADDYYDRAPARAHHPSAHPDSTLNRMQPQDDYSHSGSFTSGGSGGYDQSRNNLQTSQNHDGGYYRGGPPSVESSGIEGFHSAGQVPPPPSRTHMPQQAYSPQSTGGYAYDSVYGNHGYDQVSRNSMASSGAAGFPSTRSAPSSNFVPTDPYADDPYQGLTSRHGNNLGVVNPNEIEDDGDDGLHYHKQSQRNSMLSLSHSDRTPKQAIGTATAVGAGGGLLRKGHQGGSEYDLGTHPEKSSGWMSKQKSKSKKWKWVVIILVFLVIVGAIVGGVIGGMMSGRRSGGGGGSNNGQSASDDAKKNGDLDKNSAEIKALLNNTNLHRVFPGMDYTPLNTQYPDCLRNPPSQNNITRDVAVLSQLTNKIRLYGTDCNQTEMLVHAIDKLDLKNDVKIWLGVWQDGNDTTNARQLEQMWTILDSYGAEPFEGIIVANEILFRKEMSITQLGTIMDDVRKNLTKKSIDLPVATSDLGDDWTQALADDSDYIMANIHPFFAGVTASDAAAWTYNFWEAKNKPMWKTDNSKNIISETGWPTSGGKSCGAATSCTNGSVAGIDELNTFMADWVCEALTNGTSYFWFEAFDEPWKIRFNEPGKEWEDQWGLLTVDRKVKDGVKIPDCGGKIVS